MLERAFLEKELPRCFSYKISFNKEINFEGYEKNYQNILILKPHGSLNWALCPKCSSMHLSWSKRYDHIFNEKCGKCEGYLKPVLIPPTRAKKFNGPLKELWDIAAEKIKSAHEIAIVGLSLNDFDTEVLDHLIYHIASNHNRPRLLIADPCAMDRYCKIKELTSLEESHFEEVVLFKNFKDFIGDIPLCSENQRKSRKEMEQFYLRTKHALSKPLHL